MASFQSAALSPLLDCSQRWRGFGDPWRERLVASHGGWWFADGERSRFFPAPFVGAIGAWVDPDKAWIASSLGRVFQWEAGAWSTLPAPFLEGKTEAHVFVSDSRLFVATNIRSLHERRDGKWHKVVTRLESLHFTTRLGDAAILGDGGALYRFDGAAATKLLSAADIPGDGLSILDACPSVHGGLLLIDDAGTLARLEANGLTVLRQGRVNVSWKHTYPDPDPDRVEDRIRDALLSPSGEALIKRWGSWWHYDPRGNKAETSGPQWLIDDLPAPPPARFESTGTTLVVECADHGFTVPLRDENQGTSAPTDKDFAVGSERWRMTWDRQLEIEEFEFATRVAFTPALRSLLGPAPGMEAPRLVDLDGTVHTFDGAGFEPTRLGSRYGDPIKQPDHIVSVDDRVYVRRDAMLAYATIDPPKAERALRDADHLQALLAPGTADLVARSIPLPQERAVAQLGLFQEVGRTAAGIWLTRLLAGDAEAAGVEEHARLAQRVMCGLETRARCFLLLDGPRILGWIASQTTAAMTVVDGGATERMTRALAGEREPESEPSGQVVIRLGDWEGVVPIGAKPVLLSFTPGGAGVVLQTGPNSRSFVVAAHLNTTIHGELAAPKYGLMVEVRYWRGRMWVLSFDPPLSSLGGASLAPLTLLDWPSDVPLTWPALEGVVLKAEVFREPPAETVECPNCQESIRPRPIAYGYASGFVAELSRRHLVNLGGCIVEPGQPYLVCPSCHAKLNPALEFLAPSRFEIYREWRAKTED